MADENLPGGEFKLNPDALAEQIARIIDPNTWRVLDAILCAGQNAGYDPDALKDSASLKKAKEILALTTNALEVRYG